jgi:hypothetical protein
VYAESTKARATPTTPRATRYADARSGGDPRLSVARRTSSRRSIVATAGARMLASVSASARSSARCARKKSESIVTTQGTGSSRRAA